MDFLKKAQSALGSSSSGSTSSNPQQQQQGGQPAAEKEDYGDKAFAAVGKKFGYEGSKEQNERITDGARDFYEKQTGSKVNSKVS